MRTVYARKAWLAGGWTDDVRLHIGQGMISELETGARPTGDDERAGIVIPGLCNAHSHAFQRAMAGRAERRAPAGRDDFWSWRTLMYALASRVSPDELTIIATQAYAEMLAAGYTSVAEFHYLHDDPVGNGDAMFRALNDAAGATGIRLCYVPVLYERAGFDQAGPGAGQRRFALSLDALLEHQSRCAASAQAEPLVDVAIGAHSLRAVSLDSLKVIAGVANEQSCPLHLHIAEQQAEVEQCLAATGKRPVELLLARCEVDERYCLVHATHIDAAEVTALAETGAVVCLCPTTEANLGDGLFPLPAFLQAGGRVAIGSDSQVSIDPREELRWLEYGQRLAARARNIVSQADGHVGCELYRRTLDGGLQATGRAPGGLRVGAAADFVVLNGDDPVLAGAEEDAILDAYVFAGLPAPIDAVMVGGEWRVRHGRHLAHDEHGSAFASLMRELH